MCFIQNIGGKMKKFYLILALIFMPYKGFCCSDIQTLIEGDNTKFSSYKTSLEVALESCCQTLKELSSRKSKEVAFSEDPHFLRLDSFLEVEKDRLYEMLAFKYQGKTDEYIYKEYLDVLSSLNVK